MLIKRYLKQEGKGFGLSLYLLFFISALVFPLRASAHQQEALLAQKALEGFFKVSKATGDFVQIGPKGERSSGKFYLERPGKIRFSYKNNLLNIVSDGKSIAVHNQKLNQWSLYNLAQTPLKFILASKFEKGSIPITSVKKDAHQLQITIKQKQGQLILVFDNKTYQLRQWTTIDAQNFATKIYLSNLQQNITFAPDMFTIPYQEIAMQRRTQ